MSTSKRSASGASNFNTGRFIQPIILKIVGAFGVTALLAIAVISFALFNFKQNSLVGQRLLELEEATAYTRELPALLQAQQNQIELILLQNQDKAEHRRISYQIQSGYLQHSLRQLENGEFWEKETDFERTYLQAQEQPLEIRAGIIQTQLQPLTQAMTQLSYTFAANFSAQARNALLEMTANQQKAFETMVIISLIALLLAGLVVWFVINAILQPMGRMNQQLSQLLWTQNEHLTERLNSLQQIINTNNAMTTAVRHDIKAPLGHMKSLAQLSLITRPDLSFDTSQNLQKIVEIADSSVATLNGLLTRREIELELQKVNLAELIDKVLRLVDLRWFNITRRVEIAEAEMDAGLMEHALLNLVSNARKFSGGGIGIGASRVIRPGTVNEEELKLWVWNDGTIITAADREEIFKPGVQTAEGRAAGGHGLGLAIVQSIVERHHGRVTVESHEKKGTTFYIIIPLQELKNQLAPAIPQSSAAPAPTQA